MQNFDWSPTTKYPLQYRTFSERYSNTSKPGHFSMKETCFDPLISPLKKGDHLRIKYCFQLVLYAEVLLYYGLYTLPLNKIVNNCLWIMNHECKYCSISWRQLPWLSGMFTNICGTCSIWKYLHRCWHQLLALIWIYLTRWYCRNFRNVCVKVRVTWYWCSVTWPGAPPPPYPGVQPPPVGFNVAPDPAYPPPPAQVQLLLYFLLL